MLFFLLGIAIHWSGQGFAATDRVFSASPYRVRLFLCGEMATLLSEKSQADPASAIVALCRLQFGPLWEMTVDLPSSSFAELSSRFADPPDEWQAFDKIYVAQWSTNPMTLVEFDVKTGHVGRRGQYSIDEPAKAVDILVQALSSQFSPIARLEKATVEGATLRMQGIDLAARWEPGSFQNRVGVSASQSVFLPFVRSFDRHGKPTGTAPMPWTYLVPENFDPVTNLLHCRLESSLRHSLTTQRRGRSEVFALSIPTPLLPTLLKLRPRMDVASKHSTQVTSIQTLPVYDVMEATIPEDGGKRTIQLLGQTKADGTFLLEAHEGRPIRTLLFRTGKTLIAQVPIVRGLEAECVIPIPDDAVRLEAEAAVLGIQEEIIDTTARRSLLQLRLRRLNDGTAENKQAMVRATESELNRLKTPDRFLIDMDQARLRYRSVDSVVQRRIDILFRDARRALRSANTPKTQAVEDASGVQAGETGARRLEDDEKAIRACFDRYMKALLNNDGDDAVLCVDRKTLLYYEQLLKLIKVGTRAEVDSLPMRDKATVLLMRHRVPKEMMLAMTNGHDHFVYGITNGLLDKDSASNVELGTITVEGDTAKSNTFSVAQQREYPFGVHFNRENGEWKMDMTSVFPLVDMVMQTEVTRSGLTENEFLWRLLEASSGKKPSDSIWEPLERK